MTQTCSDAGGAFRDGPLITRMCNETGEWEEADLTPCTLAQVEQPFLLAWFVLDTSTYTHDLEERFVISVSQQYCALLGCMCFTLSLFICNLYL